MTDYDGVPLYKYNGDRKDKNLVMRLAQSASKSNCRSGD